MILPPNNLEEPTPTAFALETLGRLPLAEAFYTIWVQLAPESVLDELFDLHRGHCYHDLLSFSEIVLVLADAITVVYRL